MFEFKIIGLIVFDVVFSKNFLVRGTPQSITVEDALSTLKNVINEEKTIREFFHEHIIKPGSEIYGKPASCAELMVTGVKCSGVYTVYPKPWMKKKKIEVYCDMETEGGGWTVIQRRAEYPEKQINFTRDWHDYAKGFGKLTEEFWLGNDNIHILTTQENVMLRIDLKDFEQNSRFAEYDEIEVGEKKEKYVLTLGNYTGDAGDSFAYHSGQTFATYDQDNAHECSRIYKGGWWYDHCHYANLNGEYKRGEFSGKEVGIVWWFWRGSTYSLKETEMKIRPKHFQCYCSK